MKQDWSLVGQMVEKIARISIYSFENAPQNSHLPRRSYSNVIEKWRTFYLPFFLLRLLNRTKINIKY